MAKYVVYSDELRGELSYSGKDTDEQVLKALQAIEPQKKWHSIKKVPRGSHICKYCGEIAEGTYADLLCSDCRETFGHSLFSEL